MPQLWPREQQKAKNNELFSSAVGTFFGKGLNKTVEICSEVVARNICIYLGNKYAKQFGEETGYALAAAVANELFGRPPGNEFGEQFLKEKNELVKSRLKKLKSERQICEILNIIVHTQANIAYGTCSVTSEIIQQTVKLKEFDILLPRNETQLPTTPEKLVEKVKEFELWVTNQLKNK